MKFNKIGLLPGAAALFLTLLAAAPAAAAAAGHDPVTGEKYPEVFVIGTLNGAAQTAIPLEKGFFDDLGVPVKVLYFESGRDVNTAFASRSIQAGSFGSSPISLGVSNGLGYEVVYVNDVIGVEESLVVRNSAGVGTVAELKGRKIAAPFASTAHYSLLNAILLAGLKPEDVTLLDMQPQDILAAYIRGDIDGAYIWSPVLDELLKNDGRAVTDSGRLAEQGAVTADLTAVSREFAAKYPTLVAKYVGAFIKSYRIIAADQAEAVRLVAKNLGVDEKTALRALTGNKHIPPEEQALYLGADGRPGRLAQTLKSTADFHVSQKNLEQSADLAVYEKAVTAEFVRQALR